MLEEDKRIAELPQSKLADWSIGGHSGREDGEDVVGVDVRSGVVWRERRVLVAELEEDVQTEMRGGGQLQLLGDGEQLLQQREVSGERRGHDVVAVEERLLQRDASMCVVPRHGRPTDRWLRRHFAYF